MELTTWKIKSNQGLYSTLFVLVTLILMFAFAIKSDYYLLSIGFAVSVFWYIYSVKDLNIIYGFKNKIEIINFWTKQKMVSLNYEEIKRIEVRYWSDLGGRTKKITFYSEGNQKIRANILGVYMVDFNKLFCDKNIPIYIELNDTFVLYQNERETL